MRIFYENNQMRITINSKPKNLWIKDKNYTINNWIKEK